MKMTKSHRDTTQLSIEGERVTEEELLKAIRKTGMLKELIKEVYLERTLSKINVKEETIEEQILQYKENNGLNDEHRFKEHLKSLSLSQSLFREILSRPSKIVLYRNERWGDHVNSLYLKNKESYDYVSYKRIQSANMNLMQEVYFRLKDKEETWESIISQFPKINGKNGILKDVEVSSIEEELLSQMRKSGKGVVNFPIGINGQIVITELIETKSKELDEDLKTKILNEEFKAWLEETTTNLTKQAGIEE